jgi:membrane-associated phospholipid phosphatase
MPAVLILIYVKAYEHFRKSFFLLATGMIIALLIYTFFPSEQLLRAEIVGDNIFNVWVLLFYNNDPSINVCPSIHALNSWILACVLLRANVLHHVGHAILIIIATVIAFSTVFIKQHSIIDIIAAAVLAAVLYILFFVVGEGKWKTKKEIA